MNFSLDIDIIIFMGFLIVNLVVGLAYGRGVKTIKDYALGGRNFSTGTIAATLIATWIGGGFFAFNLSKAYSDGLPFMVAVVGNGLAVFLLGYFYGPRMGEFLGCNSVAEAMGKLYGKHVRIITAIAAILLAIGYTGLQIKVLSNLINWSLGVDSTYAAIVGTTIVVIYSAFGGIRSVTFTDIIQFLTFGAFIPGLALLIWGSFDNPESVLEVIKTSELFDYHGLFSLSWLAMFLWFTWPDLDPALFQRILIAKDIVQVRKSFIIASIGCISIIILTSWIGVLMYVKNPDLNPEQLVTSIIHYHSYTGLRGITMAGIAAMVMSTVDSYINSASVLFSNDLCKSLGIDINFNNRGLLISRCFAVFMGVVGLTIALSHNNLFNLTLMVNNFYMPVVTIPLTLAIFGFRSTTKAVLIGMAAGVATLLLWRQYLLDTGIDSIIPGMLANLSFLLGSHYLLRQPGGWVGIKDKTPLAIIRYERKRKWKNFIKAIREFNLLAFCSQNSPKQEYIYSYFAMFSIISVFSTIYLLPQHIQHDHQGILSLIYHSVLVASTMFLTYPIWPQTFKNKNFISIFWNIAIFYTLVCVSTILIIISNFSQFQLMMFVLNIFVLASLVKWQVTLLVVPLVFGFTIQIYKWYISADSLTGSIGNLQFKIIYSLLLISSVLIAFIKPKQEYQALTEEKNEHLTVRITDQEKELREAMGIRSRFIRNIQHEYHTPMTGVISTSETLWQAYDKFPDEQRKKAVNDIYTSALRLKAFDDNIVALSKLNREGYELQPELINFSDLLHDRIRTCRKLYEEDKEAREFILKIEESIIINGDNKYLTQALDNILVNSINYCPQGVVTIELKRGEAEIILIFADEGIGIPPKELEAIFDEFVVSSKTFTPAGGRGIGLAVAKRIIEAHGGRIEAKSDGVKGSIFSVVLPLGEPYKD